MAGLAAHAAIAAESGSNPDVELLYDINGLAKDAPHWLDRVMEFVGEYGLLFAMVLLILWCWWGCGSGVGRMPPRPWPRWCGRRSPPGSPCW